MKQYKYRGLDLLIPWLTTVTLLALMEGYFGHMWAGVIGVSIATGVGALVKFFQQRRMTPEQFEAFWKDKRIHFDERADMIAAKSCRVALGVMVTGCAVGLAFFCWVDPNPKAMWFMMALIILGCAAFFIARAVYSRKL